jgi:hypothetical protein
MVATGSSAAASDKGGWVALGGEEAGMRQYAR